MLIFFRRSIRTDLMNFHIMFCFAGTRHCRFNVYTGTNSETNGRKTCDRCVCDKWSLSYNFTALKRYGVLKRVNAIDERPYNLLFILG